MQELAYKLNELSFPLYEKTIFRESIEKLYKLKTYLDDSYYNTSECFFSDSRYDTLKECIKNRDNNYREKIGSVIRERDNRISLPYYLGSADKISYGEEKELFRWICKHSTKKYVISAKLDGVSCLLHKSGKNYHLYTRGDGYIGSDISHIQKYINLPCLKTDITVRGELIIPKDTFSKKYREQYKNPRNMVTGLVSRKTLKEGLSDVHFVAYEIVGNSMYNQSKQLNELNRMGFETVKNIDVKDIHMEMLSSVFMEFRGSSNYELDGIIVQMDEEYDRNTSGNPEYMFAFKMNLSNDVHETSVKHVEWNVSKWGQLKPVIIIEPVDTNGVTMSRVTANHAKYIVENSLGPGAVVKVTRSKEVIPFIVEVVKRAKEPQLPEVEYVWDKNNVNIGVKNEEEIMCVKLVSDFFSKLNIKHVSEATVSKMFENGLDSLIKIVCASKERLLEVPEFGEKSADRIYTNIRNGLKNVKLSTLLGASSVLGYGIGIKKIDTLLLSIPDILDLSKNREELIAMVNEVEGFSELTSVKIVDNLKYAKDFIEQMKDYIDIKREEKISDTLKGYKIVMSGFRDAKVTDEITKRGGKVVDSVSKNTSLLIVPERDGKLTGKGEKAKEYGIEILCRDDFVKKYLS
jgi:DNA ligase (NAD+)